MGLDGPVDAVDLLAHVEIAEVLDDLRGRVDVIVTRLVVVAEAVEMLHPQVQILKHAM